jgi:hypothetical protein
LRGRGEGEAPQSLRFEQGTRTSSRHPAVRDELVWKDGREVHAGRTR